MTARSLCLVLLASALVLPWACTRKPASPIVSPWSHALERARRENALLVVNFLLPGRPVSDAMELETLDRTPVDPAVIALRLDARDSSDLFFELMGPGPGLASCVVAPSGLVVSARRGYMDEDAYACWLFFARRHAPKILELEERSLQGDAMSLLDLCELWQLLGCGERAATRLRRAVASQGVATPAWIPRARELLARFAIEEGRVAESRRWHDAKPGLTDHARLTEALILLAAREVRAAIDLLRRLHSNPHPEEDRLLLALGTALHASGSHTEARIPFEELIARHPDSPWVSPAREHLRHLLAPEEPHIH